MAHNKVYGIYENKCKVEVYQNNYSTEKDVVVGKWIDGSNIKRHCEELTIDDFLLESNVYKKAISDSFIVDCFVILDFQDYWTGGQSYRNEHFIKKIPAYIYKWSYRGSVYSGFYLCFNKSDVPTLSNVTESGKTVTRKIYLIYDYI